MIKKIKNLEISIWIVVSILIIGISSCKDKSTAIDPEPAKTLNKTTLLDKKWYDKGSIIIHEFNSNGKYFTSGTWNWVNNSDTMEVMSSSGSPKVLWKIYWNTDNEMSCRWINNNQDILFKDKAW